MGVMPSLLVVVAVLLLQYNWTLFCPKLNTENVDLIVHGQDEFPWLLFTTEYAVKIKLLMLPF